MVLAGIASRLSLLTCWGPVPVEDSRPCPADGLAATALSRPLQWLAGRDRLLPDQCRGCRAHAAPGPHVLRVGCHDGRRDHKGGFSGSWGSPATFHASCRILPCPGGLSVPIVQFRECQQGGPAAFQGGNTTAGGGAATEPPARVPGCPHCRFSPLLPLTVKFKISKIE